MSIDEYSDWKCARCGRWIAWNSDCNCAMVDESEADGRRAERRDVLRWLREHNAPPVLISGIVDGLHLLGGGEP